MKKFLEALQILVIATVCLAICRIPPTDTVHAGVSADSTEVAVEIPASEEAAAGDVQVIEDVAPHKFVPSVDSPQLCHVCNEAEVHKNHPRKESEAIEVCKGPECDGQVCSGVACQQPQAVAAGRWVLVNQPIYGPLGRQRGSQQVWQWQGSAQQTYVNYGACSSCSRR